MKPAPPSCSFRKVVRLKLKTKQSVPLHDIQAGPVGLDLDLESCEQQEDAKMYNLARMTIYTW